MPTLHFPDLNPGAAGDLITGALREWHDAQQTGRPVMPHLFASLHGPHCALLAPVLHSLFRFYQAALSRAPVIGRSEGLSDDETLLLALVSCPDLSREMPDCPAGLALGFDCALCSARIMLARAFEDQHNGGCLH